MHARTHVGVFILSDSRFLERVFGSRVALCAEDIIYSTSSLRCVQLHQMYQSFANDYIALHGRSLTF